MDSKIRNIFLILFFIAFLATIIIYFSSNRDIKLTWYTGGAAILFYLIYRFSKK